MPLRLAFMGTPEFAVPCLTEIVSAGHDVACVYTQPPRPAGRGQAERKSPVHAAAETLGVPVRTPSSMRDPEAIEAFAALKLDLAVVVAFGQILPQPVLDAPLLGCVNVHASLLPRWRGAAPIHRAILAGDDVTGVQIMRMEAGLDTGPILLSESTPITPFDTAGSLHDRLAALGAALLPRALGALERGAAIETPQATEGVTYAKKIDKAEARIDWSLPAVEIDRRIRGLSPFPGAWFEVETEKGWVRVKALKSRFEPDAQPGAAAHGVALDDALLIAGGDGRGAVRLIELQREGRSPQDADAFLNGLPLRSGVRLS